MLNFPDLEQRILKFWQDQDIFQKTLLKKSPKGRFVFFEGPPTANGRPGIHHVLARVFKDLIPRYKTMQGFKVERKAGWDTQGLPVELQVEKELGFKGKPDIEAYGVTKFNAQCKEDVWKYLADWEKLTERIGFWVDLKNRYVTYENSYIESLWWILQQVNKSGYLYQDYKVLPHCPRCGTALSSHEVALGYKSVKETSVYIKFKLKSEEDTYILSWTTTPWTLPGNVALAVNENIEYVEIQERITATISSDGNYEPACNEKYYIAKDIFAKSDQKIPRDDRELYHFKGKIYEILRAFKGRDLIGLEYEPLFKGAIPESTKGYENAFKVYPADFVTTTDGTGVVHTAVMYGEDDFVLGSKIGLPKFHTVDEEGKFVSAVTKWAGKFVKDKEVEQGIIADLQNRGLLLREELYEHDYPFCWRCSTPLLYYAKPSWFIKMSALREDLKEANKKINWHPEHLQVGRFGEWLEGLKDWAISRERYWGTPLPIWICESCKKLHCVGSFKELSELATSDEQKQLILSDKFDPHRPFVDDIKIKCDCGGTMSRVPEVADCWFDSGCMPFAQWGYPNTEGSHEALAEHYPADFISEAIDQTRGWFYTLLAVSVLVKKSGAVNEVDNSDLTPPYKNVICLGHINDKYGQKMSKSKGNIIDPWEMINTYGVDAVRWHFYTANQPGEPKNFDPQAVADVTKRTFLILMNVVTFYEMYKGEEIAPVAVPTSNNVLDNWVVTLWQQTLNKVTLSLDSYEITEAGRELASFVTELSTWYVRRSRDRFKQGGAEQVQAVATLGYILRSLCLTLAPFIPFTAEEIYQRVSKKLESVHLEEWPEVKELTQTESDLLVAMGKLRQVVEMTLAKRAEVKIKVRQPLRELKVTGLELSDNLKVILADEVNVMSVVSDKTGELEIELDINIDQELKQQGWLREFARQINAYRKQLKLTINDRPDLLVSGPEVILGLLEKEKDSVMKDILVNSLSVNLTGNYDQSISIDDMTLTVKLK